LDGTFDPFPTSEAFSGTLLFSRKRVHYPIRSPPVELGVFDEDFARLRVGLQSKRLKVLTVALESPPWTATAKVSANAALGDCVVMARV
jgi:hypothetical protein